MSLPILKIVSTPTPQTLVRYFLQTESNWSGDLAESASLDCGTAWSNPQFAGVPQANRMMDVAVLGDASPAQAVEQADAHFESLGTKCLEWIMNPSAPPEQTVPLIEHLLSQHGFQRAPRDIYHLDRLTVSLGANAGAGVTIIPARASYKHASALFAEWAEERQKPQLAEAEIQHLDDSHYDALLALKDGQAIAHAGVLAMGEIGRIDQVYVSRLLRRKSIGIMMMNRIMEVCARSLFKHVLLAVEGENAAAIKLFEKFGFRKIAQVETYIRSCPNRVAPELPVIPNGTP